MKLILLDCDGVLVDSEILVNRKFVQLLSAKGVGIDEDTGLKEFTGLSAQSVYKLLSQKYQIQFDDEEINYIQREIQSELSLNVKAIPGVQDFFNKLINLKLPFCIVSSGTPECIRGSLKTAGLISYFVDEHIFSSKMVANGKPAPDLFLHAAKAFNCLPENCLVIEDSHFGIQAANAAGMDSIAFFGGQHAQQDWYRDKVLEQNPTIACETMIDVVNKLQYLLEKSYAL